MEENDRLQNPHLRSLCIRCGVPWADLPVLFHTLRRVFPNLCELEIGAQLVIRRGGVDQPSVQPEDVMKDIQHARSRVQRVQYVAHQLGFKLRLLKLAVVVKLECDVSWV